MNSIGVSIVTLLGAVVLFAPRRWALVGMMGGVLYLTEQQAIDVLGLNVTAIRLLEVIGIGARHGAKGVLLVKCQWRRSRRTIVLWIHDVGFSDAF